MEHDQGEIGKELGAIVDKLAGMVEFITTFISSIVEMQLAETCTYKELLSQWLRLLKRKMECLQLVVDMLEIRVNNIRK